MEIGDKSGNNSFMNESHDHNVKNAHNQGHWIVIDNTSQSQEINLDAVMKQHL